MMKNLNLKTGLTRKGGIFAGVITSLATAAVLAMAPTSQAFAVDFDYVKLSTTDKTKYEVHYKGTYATYDEAKANLKKGTGCSAKYDGKTYRGKQTSYRSKVIKFSETSSGAFYVSICKAFSTTSISVPKK